MHEQRGNFNGTDTCNITSYHNFNFRSKLSSEAESRSLLNRPDINALLSQLCEEEKISNFMANAKRLLAARLYDNFDFEPYYFGANYIPKDVAISLQKEESDPYYEVIISIKLTNMRTFYPKLLSSRKNVGLSLCILAKLCASMEHDF